MTATEREAPGCGGLPRWSLASLGVLHAAIFAWVAVVLPWRSWTILSILSLLMVVGHLVTAGLAALAHRRLALVWRLSSVLSLAFAAYVGWGLLSSAWYISSTYRGLGEGVGAALLAVVGLVVLVTVPLAAWGIAATGGIRRWRPLGGAAFVVLVLAGGRLALDRREAQGETIASAAQAEEVEAALGAPRLAFAQATKKKKPTASLMNQAPAVCEALPSLERVTLVATYLVVGDDDKPHATSRCFQAATPAQAVDALLDAIREEALQGDIKLDLVEQRYALPSDAPLVESLVFRPGLDGACAANGRCLMPWQLVALDAFISHAPITAVPDARLGVSLELLGKRLDAAPAALTRISTRSWLWSTGVGLTPLARTMQPNVEVNQATVLAAADAAAKYVFFSQNKQGRFNYIVMPFTGQVIDGDFSIARQAGTTLAACELASDAWTTKLARRSLELLAKHEQRFSIGGEEAGVLRFKPRGTVERLGPTALSLAAFIACRGRVGPVHDELIARLARTVLALQRTDGSFHHNIDVQQGAPAVRKGSIFVDGQAVYALSLMETVANDEAGVFPPREVFHAAAERAMTFFGEDYWNSAIEPFLYIEENWHCIAAAGSLGHHRNAAYEQFCLDYVAMKARILHEPGSAVAADFIGGYGFGNVVPPHNTATAGYGEALAGAIKIKRAQGLDVTADVERMKWVMGFLLANQWTERACYACAPTRRIEGAFSEHMASPSIRIDYVQHVWSALGHGAMALGWTREPS